MCYAKEYRLSEERMRSELDILLHVFHIKHDF